MKRALGIILGLALIVWATMESKIPPKRDTLITVEDFHPGDTLRYTTDGSVPDRTSRYVIYGANRLPVTQTTTFNARLYRKGFPPSEVKSATVYVQEAVTPIVPLLKK